MLDTLSCLTSPMVPQDSDCRDVLRIVLCCACGAGWIGRGRYLFRDLGVEVVMGSEAGRGR